MNRRIGLLRQQVAGDVDCRVVVHLLVEPLFVEIIVVQQHLQRIDGRLRHTVPSVGHDQFDATARIERAFDLGLAVVDVPIEPGEILLQQQPDAGAERLCFILLELLGFLQLGLQEVERFRGGVVVDRIQPLVVEIVHHGSGGVLWRDVEQLVQGEGAEGTRELLGSLILRLRRTQEGRKERHEALRQNLLQDGHVLWFKGRHVSGTSRSGSRMRVSSPPRWSRQLRSAPCSRWLPIRSG